MKKPFNDGGLAFPHSPALNSNGDYIASGAAGMSMREWYAATVPITELGLHDFSPVAMRKFLGDPVMEEGQRSTLQELVELTIRAVAKARFLQADAMIAESMRRPE